MATFSNHFTPKLPMNFACETCDFFTCNKKDFDRHNKTTKHKINQNQPISPNFTPKNPLACACGKIYKDKSGLWRHKKNCKIEENDTNIQTEEPKDISINEIDKEQLILMLIKQNSELIKETSEFKNIMMEQQNMMMEVIKNGTHNTTHTNSHNKSFNLQFFLNETCKNAMNINEFVDSLQLQMSDLENVGEVGYIEGISSIIIKKLNTMDITERPIHCTDKKRETMYIKDENKWEKEDEKHLKMHKMVRKVANKNINLISEFQKLHPEWKKCSSKYADQHNKIVIESMGGKGDNDYEKEEKIIKKIAKEVFVEK
jgi:hypothetical protein